MPVGGRINRRDNLRSKITSNAKSKSTKNGKSIISSSSSSSNIIAIDSTKSETNALKTLKNFHIPLEDFKLNESLMMEINNEKKIDEEEEVKETTQTRGKSIKRTKINEVNEQKSVEIATIDVSIVDTPRKKGRPKKKEITEENRKIDEEMNEKIDLEIIEKEKNEAKLADGREKETEDSEEVKKTGNRSESRLGRNKKPFVVEKNRVSETGDGASKIPGLLMLENIRKRRSELMDKKKLDEKEKELKIDNAEEETKPKKSAGRPKKTDEKPIEIEETPVIVVEEIKPKKLIGRPKKTDEKEKIEEIPIVLIAEETSDKKEELKTKKMTGRSQKTDNEENKIEENPIVSIEKEELKTKKVTARSKKPDDKEKVEEKSELKTKKIDGISKEMEKIEPEISKTKIIGKSLLNKEKKIDEKPIVSDDGKEEIKKRIFSRSNRNEGVPAEDKSKLVRKSINPVEEKPIIISSEEKSIKKDEEPKKLARKSIAEPDKIASAKIPGLKMIEDLRKRKSALIQPPVVKQEVRQRVSAVEKVPGLLTIDDIRSQKEARASTPQSDRVIDSQSKKETRVPAPETPVKIVPFEQSLRSYTPTRSILSRPSPSPFKRSMAALDSQTDQRPAKQSRQSVTFNQLVEVKEILGSSFNSDTADSVPQPTDAATEEELRRVERQISEELERTKKRIAERRMNNSLQSASQSQSELSSRARIAHPVSRPLAKKNSDLSELISARARTHTHTTSPPTLATHFTDDNNRFGRSGALRKVGQVSHNSSCVTTNTITSAMSSTSSNQNRQNWKSFHPATNSNTNQLPQESDDDDCEDDSTRDNHDQSNEKDRYCSIM